MAQAQTGDTVIVHYTGRFDDGTVFDSSVDNNPLQLTLGDGEVIPGFEESIIGMNPGDTKTVQISEDQAYGPRDPELAMVVPREEIPEDVAPEVGQMVQVTQDDSEPFFVMVTDVSDEGITLDANHPLAGQTLTFDIELMEIVQSSSPIILAR